MEYEICSSNKTFLTEFASFTSITATTHALAGFSNPIMNAAVSGKFLAVPHVVAREVHTNWNYNQNKRKV